MGLHEKGRDFLPGVCSEPWEGDAPLEKTIKYTEY